MKPPLIVAIDGPSGAGKSTVARALALRLGVPYIDTGAMYRAVGLAARERGVPAADPGPGRRRGDRGPVRVELVPSAEGSRVLLDGRDVSEAIRAPEISLYASAVSAIPAVRRRLVEQQQRLGRERGGIMEGRDIGTKVFPEAPFKFFLTAAPAVRARRRTLELAARGTPQPYETVLRGDGKARPGRRLPGRFPPDPGRPVRPGRLQRPAFRGRGGRHRGAGSRGYLTPADGPA